MGGLSRQGSLIARGPRYSLYLERGHRLVQPASRTHSPPRYHRRARGLSLDPPCPARKVLLLLGLVSLLAFMEWPAMMYSLRRESIVARRTPCLLYTSPSPRDY